MEKKKSDNKEKSTKSNDSKTSKSKDNKTTKSKDSKTSSKKTAPTKKGKLNVADENALKDFLVDELKDIYFAEHEILKGLTKMKDGATSDKLKKAIDLHYNQTEAHIVRLEEAFGLLDEKPEKKNVKP